MFNDWETIKNHSGGAQGTTHLVKQEGDDAERIYVLKKLIKKKDIAKAVARFRREIQIGLDLKHDNILKVVDFDIDSDKPFLVSEYCSGGTLKDLDLQSLSVLEKLNIFLQICKAIGFAHSYAPRIIHRDLKPENIFLKEDRKTPVVGDFGICFVDDDGDRLTLMDEAVGARKFTAPELEDGRNESITAASDVYSLGKILYWMTSGGRIFARENQNDDNWNLTKDSTKPEIFAIYGLLNKTVVSNPNERLKDGNEVAENVEKIISKIMKNGHYIDFTVPQECLYCGEGLYDKLIEFDYEHRRTTYSFESARNMIGYNIDLWQKSILVLVCDYCGNEQRFRPFWKGWGNGKWKGLLPQGMAS